MNKEKSQKRRISVSKTEANQLMMIRKEFNKHPSIKVLKGLKV